MSDYSKGEHDFQLDDFEPGRVHRLEGDRLRFGVELTPAIGLCDPKYPHNVGAAVRAASCFGGRLVVFSGSRVPVDGKKGWRLPREERMRGYGDITILNDDYFFDRFPKSVTPVAVEMRESAEPLPSFVHPENPLYVFGPEDGSLPQTVLRHCHRFVVIPSKHCVNLGSAVNILLYDRLVKRGVVRRDDLSW